MLAKFCMGTSPHFFALLCCTHEPNRFVRRYNLLLRALTWYPSAFALLECFCFIRHLGKQHSEVRTVTWALDVPFAVFPLCPKFLTTGFFRLWLTLTHTLTLGAIHDLFLMTPSSTIYLLVLSSPAKIRAWYAKKLLSISNSFANVLTQSPPAMMLLAHPP